MRYLYTPIRVAKIQKTNTNSNCWPGPAQQGLSFIAGGNASGAAALEGSSAVARYSLTVGSSHRGTLGIYSADWNTSVYIKPAFNIYSSFIHNCQKLEATTMSFNWWVAKPSVVHADNGIWFSKKKEKKINEAVQGQGRVLDPRCSVKAARLKGYFLYDSVYMIFHKRQNSETKTRPVVVRGRPGGGGGLTR